MATRFRTIAFGLMFVLVGFAAALVLTSQNAQGLSPTTDELQKQITELTKRLDALEAGVKVTPGGISIQTSGSMSLKGAAVQINGDAFQINGGVVRVGKSVRPVARVGDRVIVAVVCPDGGGSCGGTAEIVTGSSTLLAN